MYNDTDILYNGDEKILHAKDLISDWEHIKAKRVLEEVLEENPLNEVAHYLLAHIYDQWYNSPDDAFVHYERSVKINPKFWEGVTMYCQLLLKSEQPRLALQFAKKGTMARSTYKTALKFICGQAYEMLFERNKALEIYHEILLSSVHQNDLESAQDAVKRIEDKEALAQSSSRIGYGHKSYEVVVV